PPRALHALVAALAASAGCGRSGLYDLAPQPAVTSDAGARAPDTARDLPPDRADADEPQPPPPPPPPDPVPDSGPPVPVCVPTPETCNGVDDDCDGQVDEDQAPI